jgi:SAM-dependent methyltransferase
MRNRGAFDQIAEFYDDDMGRRAPAGDIDFYVSQARLSGGPILELGCGTGRITIPMVKAGHEVEGADASLPMLNVLRAKADNHLTPLERERLSLREIDMRDYESSRSFALIICPYSAFNYLLEELEQTKVLEKARELLRPGGRFVLDTFVPHYDSLLCPDEHLFQDYEHALPDGSVLRREKTIHKDLTNQINVVTRTYRFLSADGSETRRVVTQEKIRHFFHSEMRLLLQKCGFRVEDEYGDFLGSPYRYEAQTMIFVCCGR